MATTINGIISTSTFTSRNNGTNVRRKIIDPGLNRWQAWQARQTAAQGEYGNRLETINFVLVILMVAIIAAMICIGIWGSLMFASLFIPFIVASALLLRSNSRWEKISDEHIVSAAGQFDSKMHQLIDVKQEYDKALLLLTPQERQYVPINESDLNKEIWRLGYGVNRLQKAWELQKTRSAAGDMIQKSLQELSEDINNLQQVTENIGQVSVASITIALSDKDNKPSVAETLKQISTMRVQAYKELMAGDDDA